MSAGSCYSDPLQSDFSLTTHRRVFHLFWNVEDLGTTSACFGRVNRDRCLSAVDASEHGNLPSPWRAGLVQRLAFSLGHWSVNRCSKYSWLTSCQSPISQQWTTSSVIWKLITDLQYRFAFFPKHKWNFLSKSVSGWFRYMSKEVSLPAPFKLIFSITVTELEDTAKKKIAPCAFHFHSLRTLSLIKKMNLQEQCVFVPFSHLSGAVC